MQLEKAFRLKREWGNKPCGHPNIEKEYHLGSDTGDFVCTKCGKSMSKKEWELEIKKEVLIHG